MFGQALGSDLRLHLNFDRFLVRSERSKCSAKAKKKLWADPEQVREQLEKWLGSWKSAFKGC